MSFPPLLLLLRLRPLLLLFSTSSLIFVQYLSSNIMYFCFLFYFTCFFFIFFSMYTFAAFIFVNCFLTFLFCLLHHYIFSQHCLSFSFFTTTVANCSSYSISSYKFRQVCVFCCCLRFLNHRLTKPLLSLLLSVDGGSCISAYGIIFY